MISGSFASSTKLPHKATPFKKEKVKVKIARQDGYGARERIPETAIFWRVEFQNLGAFVSILGRTAYFSTNIRYREGDTRSRNSTYREFYIHICHS